MKKLFLTGIAVLFLATVTEDEGRLPYFSQGLPRSMWAVLAPTTAIPVRTGEMGPANKTA